MNVPLLLIDLLVVELVGPDELEAGLRSGPERGQTEEQGEQARGVHGSKGYLQEKTPSPRVQALDTAPPAQFSKIMSTTHINIFRIFFLCS